MPPEQIHASCVAIGGKGVLLFGPSGSGKSDLALRLIDEGAVLVGDDQVILRNDSNHLLASPAPNIHGMIEARAVGILHLPYLQDAAVALAVKLVPHAETERLPHPAFWSCLGLQVPLLSLDAFHSSTPAKIRLFLTHKE